MAIRCRTQAMSMESDENKKEKDGTTSILNIYGIKLIELQVALIPLLGFVIPNAAEKQKFYHVPELRIHVIRLIDCLGFPKPYQERK